MHFDGKDAFLWLPTGIGTTIPYETAVCFNYKHSDSGTVTVELAVVVA